MSDYLFMLESHLTQAQAKAVAAVEAAVDQAEDQLFLTGGAMRDMLGGFPITDLDFTVQGNALAVARKVARSAGVSIVSTDTLRKSAELVFPGGVTVEIAMARTEEYPKAGGPPKVKPTSIHDDLPRRDFTINSIALSLNPASRGLLLDPTNGLSDLERRELRAYGHYGFYDDPVRMLRMIRFRIRLGYAVEERTQEQYENARQAGMEAQIPARALFRELRCIADQPNAGEVMAALEREKLVHLFSPSLRGSKLNLPALHRLEKARQLIPHGFNLNLDNLGPFVYFLTEKLTSKEKAALAKGLQMTAAEKDLWQKLEARSRKLETDLKSPKLHRPSEVYVRLRAAPGDEILFLALHSDARIVRDRIRNFLQKYLFVAQEVTDRDVVAETGASPEDPKFAQFKFELIAARLDGRKWRPAAETAEARARSRSPRKARTTAVGRVTGGRRSAASE